MSAQEHIKNFKEINEWEVLTPSGWQDFDGIKKVKKSSYMEIFYRLPSGEKQTLKCSKGHQIYTKRGDEHAFTFAELLVAGVDEILYEDNKTFCEILNVKTVEKKKALYDLVNVKNGYEYIANNVVNHNCAHIEGINDLWLGLSPTLSTGGQAILISSPSGVGTFFHNMWIGAENQDNGFLRIELPWTVHPERDEKWFEAQKKELLAAKGESGVGMELLCSFVSSGNTFISGDALEKLLANIKEPIEKIKEGVRSDIWIWKKPAGDHQYVIGADVATGQGEDFSAFHIIDTTTDEVVVDFKGKLPPDKFATVLIKWGKIYNQAMICQEFNNTGIATAIALKESGYPNLYYEKFMKNIYMSYVTKDIGDELPGYTVNPNTREQILAKMEHSVRNGLIRLYSKRLYEEFQTFIYKKSGALGREKPQARKGHHDDLIMAFAIACNLYEASGRTMYQDSEAQWALVGGMSRDTQQMNPTTGRTSDGFFSNPNKKRQQRNNMPMRREQLEKSKVESMRHSNTHNYNDAQWDQFRWLFEN